MPVNSLQSEASAIAAPDAPMMAGVPHRERHRILVGMRWTVWLSVLAAPFSYGTTMMLARVGPEVIGTYGLLMVYVAAASSLLYMGGDSVTIKFVPSLPVEKRFSFLSSYFLVVCAALVPWLVVATVWPSGLHYIFGKSVPPALQLLMIYLAPIYIARTMIISGLTAILDMRWAQSLNRVVTVGTFFLYGLLFLVFPRFLKANYTTLVWGIYLGFAVVTFVIGLKRLVKREEWRCSWRKIRFFLPKGFWKYTLALQQISALGFFLYRLDMLLVLNRGGLEVLGRYVAILTVASIVFLANRLFCDTLLPALTNLMAAGNPKAASEVFSANLRMLFAIHLTVACAVMFLMEPLVDLMGSKYSNEKALFKLLVILYALGGPGGLGGTLLTAVGKQQLSVWVGAIQLAIYLGAFTFLWPHYGLLGAVIAIGGSSLVCQIALLAVARLKGPLEFPYRRDYFWFVVLGSLAGCVAIGAGTPGFITGVLGCTVPIGAFLLLARYQRRELVGLASCLFPGWKTKVKVIGEQVDG